MKNEEQSKEEILTRAIQQISTLNEKIFKVYQLIQGEEKLKGLVLQAVTCNVGTKELRKID